MTIYMILHMRLFPTWSTNRTCLELEVLSSGTIPTWQSHIAWNPLDSNMEIIGLASQKI